MLNLEQHHQIMAEEQHTHHTHHHHHHTHHQHKYVNLKLMYWNARGLMEPARQMLALGGKFPGQDYEDFRASQPPSDAFLENNGRMPFVYDNGKGIGQSATIWRYIAHCEGLMGTGHIEGAHIDGIVETVKELLDSWGKIFPYGNTFDDQKKQEVRDLYFNTVSTTRTDRYFQWHLNFLEQIVGDDGFAVGGKYSLADAVLAYRLGDVAPNLASKGEPFTSLEQTNKALEKYPKIAKIVANWYGNPNIQKWIQTRGDQGS